MHYECWLLDVAKLDPPWAICSESSKENAHRETPVGIMQGSRYMWHVSMG